MTTRTLAVVSAGLSEPSSTRLLADRLTEAVRQAAAAQGIDVLVEPVELRPLARDLANHLVTGFPSPALESALASVTRADARVAVFRVTRVAQYAKDAFPTSLVYGDIDHAGLRLITCGGSWDAQAHHYTDNTVVFAS